MRLTILTALLFSFIATPVLSEKVKKPKLEVKARPRTQFMKPSDPFKEVRLDITIKNANEEWWCSVVAIFWGDGSKTIIEPSCTYFEDADKSDIKRTRFQRKNLYRRPGEYTIVVLIGKDEDLIAKKEVKVSIRG